MGLRETRKAREGLQKSGSIELSRTESKDGAARGGGGDHTTRWALQQTGGKKISCPFKGGGKVAEEQVVTRFLWPPLVFRIKRRTRQCAVTSNRKREKKKKKGEHNPT